MKGLIKVIIILLVILSGCEDAFEYSPYAANVKNNYKNIGKKNLDVIFNNNKGQSEFSFAVFADSHYNFHELDEAIKNVNARNDVDFVIVNGDIADHGYLKEYELFHERMKKLNVPYLTVIGNHDYRSNGEKIYKDMYGNVNYTLEFGNSYFIFWDSVFWESNKSPDFKWLERKLQDTDKYKNVFVICHIPPFGSQFNEASEIQYSDLMSQYNVSLSVHGHTHSNYLGEYYNDKIQYLVVESIIDEQFAIVSVNDDSISVNAIKY